jgi:hypothetical protein
MFMVSDAGVIGQSPRTLLKANTACPQTRRIGVRREEAEEFIF